MSDRLYIPAWTYNVIYGFLLCIDSSPPEPDNMIHDDIFKIIETLLNNNIKYIIYNFMFIDQISVGEYFNTVTVHTEGVKHVIPFDKICCEGTGRTLPLLYT
jgi:hypothetical protein